MMGTTVSGVPREMLPISWGVPILIVRWSAGCRVGKEMGAPEEWGVEGVAMVFDAEQGKLCHCGTGIWGRGGSKSTQQASSHDGLVQSCGD